MFWCVDFVLQVDTNAANNDAFEPDDSGARKHASVMSNDVTLCENTLYAQSPEQVQVPGATPLYHDANAHGMCLVSNVHLTLSLSADVYEKARHFKLLLC